MISAACHKKPAILYEWSRITIKGYIDNPDSSVELLQK